MNGAEVKTIILDRLRGHGARINNLEEELESVLIEISARDDFIKTSTTLATVDGTASYAEPTRLKNMEAIQRSGGNYLKLSTFEEHQKYIEDNSSPFEGEPVYYAIRGGYIWLRPIPDTAYTFTEYYSKYHTDLTSTLTIELDNKFREAVYNGVLANLFAGQLSDAEDALQKYQFHKALYEEEIAKQRMMLWHDPHIVRYKDI